MQTNISYLSPLRDNIIHIKVFFFLEEQITQHPPDAQTQIHTQCEDRVGLDSIWVLPSTGHLMCPKFSILYSEDLQTERGETRGRVRVVVVVSAHMQASHLHTTSVGPRLQMKYFY